MMKDDRGRKLTRRQKIILSSQVRKLNPQNWVCVSDDGKVLEVRHRISGRIASIRYA